MSWSKRDDRDSRERPDDRERGPWRPRNDSAPRGRGGSFRPARGGRGGRGGRDFPRDTRDVRDSRDRDSYRDHRDDSQWPDKPWKERDRDDRSDRSERNDRGDRSNPPARLADRLDRRQSGPPGSGSVPSTPSGSSLPPRPFSAPRHSYSGSSTTPNGPGGSAPSGPSVTPLKRNRKRKPPPAAVAAANSAATQSNIHNPNNPNYIGYTKKEARTRQQHGDESPDLMGYDSFRIQDSPTYGSDDDGHEEEHRKRFKSISGTSTNNSDSGGPPKTYFSLPKKPRVDSDRDSDGRSSRGSDRGESRSRGDARSDGRSDMSNSATPQPRRGSSYRDLSGDRYQEPPQFDDDAIPCYGDDEPGESKPPSRSHTPAVTQRTLKGSIFERVSQVGEGTYGKVYKAVNQVSGSTAALKRLRLESEREGFPVTALREIKLLQSLRHDNIISLKEMMVEEGGVFMVFGYMDHDLSGILAHPTLRLSEGHIKFLFRQIISGLSYIHRRGVLHRDIKGSNILVDTEGNLKLADFGLSRTIDLANKDAQYSNRVITLWYRPPELLFGTTFYDGAVDNWGAGCLLLELYARQAMFRGQDEVDQLDCIFNIMGTPTNEYWPEVEQLPWFQMLRFTEDKPCRLQEKYSELSSEPAMKLATKLLEMNPAKRMTAQQAFESDYFDIEPLPERPLLLRELEGEWHEFDAKKLRRAQRKDEEVRRAKERKERKEAEAKGKEEEPNKEEGQSREERTELSSRDEQPDSSASVPSAQPSEGGPPSETIDTAN